MKKLTLTLPLLALAIVAMPMSASADRGNGPFHDYYGTYLHDHKAVKRIPRQARFERKTEARLDRQEDRIRHGLRNGSLTRKEAKRLIRQNRRLDRMYDHALADGRITKQERRRINKRVLKASDTIVRLKHNRRNTDRRVVIIRHH